MSASSDLELRSKIVELTGQTEKLRAFIRTNMVRMDGIFWCCVSCPGDCTQKTEDLPLETGFGFIHAADCEAIRLAGLPKGHKIKGGESR